MPTPSTDYYNLDGNYVRSIEDSVAGKKLVLTMLTDTNTIDDLIRRYKCIDVPSKAIIDTMKKCITNCLKPMEEKNTFSRGENREDLRYL